MKTSQKGGAKEAIGQQEKWEFAAKGLACL